MQSPDEAERQRVGDKLRALANHLRATESVVVGRKRFTPYTDEQLRKLYPPREPAPAPAVELALDPL